MYIYIYVSCIIHFCNFSPTIFSEFGFPHLAVGASGELSPSLTISGRHHPPMTQQQQERGGGGGCLNSRTILADAGWRISEENLSSLLEGFLDRKNRWETDSQWSSKTWQVISNLLKHISQSGSFPSRCKITNRFKPQPNFNCNSHQFQRLATLPPSLRLGSSGCLPWRGPGKKHRFTNCYVPIIH